MESWPLPTSDILISNCASHPIFHYICYASRNLHYMYTSLDELTTCTIHKAGVYMNRYLLVERKAILHANQ